MKSISASARHVLRYFVEPTLRVSRKIDAKDCAEEIIELLRSGYVQLGGTLQSATLDITPEGVEALEAYERACGEPDDVMIGAPQ